MSKKKGLSRDEKLDRMLELFRESVIRLNIFFYNHSFFFLFEI